MIFLRRFYFTYSFIFFQCWELNTVKIWRNWKNKKSREKSMWQSEQQVCGRLYFLKLAKAGYVIQYVPYNMTLKPCLGYKHFFLSAFTECGGCNTKWFFATISWSCNTISPHAAEVPAFIANFLSYDRASPATEKRLYSIPKSRVSYQPIATSTTYPGVKILPSNISPFSLWVFFFFQWRLHPVLWSMGELPLWCPPEVCDPEMSWAQ